MGNWGIAETATPKEKLKSEFVDYLNGLNSIGNINYETYCKLFDFGTDLLDKMYDLAKSELELDIKQQNQKQEHVMELLDLIQENPQLPILPMVSTECVPSDDYSWWMASWGSAEIDEYLVCGERIYFKSTGFDDVVDLQFDDSDCDEEQAKLKAEKLDWIKAIVVRIDTP